MAANEAALTDYVPSSEEIAELLDEVRCLTMASHLFWTLWAIVNVHQEIEFGYWVSNFNSFYLHADFQLKIVSGLRCGSHKTILCCQRGIQQIERTRSKAQAHFGRKAMMLSHHSECS